MQRGISSVANPGQKDYNRHIKIIFHEYMKNTHIKNLAARYAVDHLRSSKEYDELYQDIRTLIYFMDNEYVRKAINYLRYYASTIKRRELAIQHIKEYLTHDSLLYYTENQEADSLDYILSQQNLRTLISFLEHDNAYQWLKEKGRDSIPLTLLTVGEEKKKIWLNNGKDRFHRIMTENLAGDTISGWIKTSSKGNEIKIYLDEETLKYLYKKYNLYVFSNWFYEAPLGRLENVGYLKYFKKI